jgi:23S rRNA (cytidine1920-2'-O)/16S rRNA (cytidine1409-2'-O)-methyltransferase
LSEGIDQARDRIGRGEVLVGGASASNPSRLVSPHEPVAWVGPAPRYVGRGADKLAAALEHFAVDVAGRRAVDVGSSTGGFTDCLLQAGATAVVAVDVGRGQLHQRLRTDPRVEVHERTNIRHLDPATVAPRAGVVVADLSFISLGRVAPALLALAAPGADLVVLVKPQFKARRAEVDAGGGVIADPEVWRRVLREVCATFAIGGAAIMGLMTSPLRGADGNVEFLLHLRRPHDGPVGPDPDQVDLAAAVDAAVRAAAS